MRPDVRDRLVLPILIPVGLLAVIFAVATAFGMLLFFLPLTVSLAVASVGAAGILAAFALASAATDLTRAKRAVIAFAGAAPLLVGALVASGVVETRDPRVVDRECEYCVPEDAVRVVADNLAFDQDQLRLPAGGDASILFINQDQGIPHNVAIYPQQPGGPLLDQPIFQGTTFPGVDQQVYTFEAPEPGEYYFHCDVHPNMNGTALVEEGAAGEHGEDAPPRDEVGGSGEEPGRTGREGGPDGGDGNGGIGGTGGDGGDPEDNEDTGTAPGGGGD